MHLTINNQTRLEPVNETHAQAIYELVDENRPYLREWLPWVDRALNVNFIHDFIRGSLQRNSTGTEYAFVIIRDEQVVGRIGVYKIDSQNRTGEIGYWIGQQHQGKGTVTASCAKLLELCFGELNLNRVEIRCGSENKKSQVIPERLGFKKEGVLRQAELVHGKFIDLCLYAHCKNDK